MSQQMPNNWAVSLEFTASETAGIKNAATNLKKAASDAIKLKNALKEAVPKLETATKRIANTVDAKVTEIEGKIHSLLMLANALDGKLGGTGGAPANAPGASPAGSSAGAMAAGVAAANSADKVQSNRQTIIAQQSLKAAQANARATERLSENFTMSLKEFAQITGGSTDFIRRQRNAGLITETVTKGKQVKYKPAALDQYDALINDGKHTGMVKKREQARAAQQSALGYRALDLTPTVKELQAIAGELKTIASTLTKQKPEDATPADGDPQRATRTKAGKQGQPPPVTAADASPTKTAKAGRLPVSDDTTHRHLRELKAALATSVKPSKAGKQPTQAARGDATTRKSRSSKSDRGPLGFTTPSYSDRALSSAKQSNAMGDASAPIGVRFSDAAVRAGLYGTAAGAIFGGVRSLQQSLKVMGEYEDSLIGIKRVINPLGSDMGHLSKQARELGKEFGISIVQVADAMRIYAQQGKGMGDIIQQTRTALLATNVTELDAVAATEALTAALNQFNLAQSESMRVLDAWNEVENTTSVNVTRLTEAVKKAGVSVRVSGMDFDEFNGIIAATGEATRKSGQEIGTAMKFIFQRMGTDQAVEALQNIGIYTIDNEGKLKKSAQTLSNLGAKWDKLTDAQRNYIAIQLAGTRQANFFLTMMDNYDRALDITATSLSSQGSAMRENAISMEALSKKVGQLGASWSGLMVELGDSGVLTALKSITESLSGVVGLINDINDASSGLTGGLMPMMMMGMGGAALGARMGMAPQMPDSLARQFRVGVHSPVVRSRVNQRLRRQGYGEVGNNNVNNDALDGALAMGAMGSWQAGRSGGNSQAVHSRLVSRPRTNRTGIKMKAADKAEVEAAALSHVINEQPGLANTWGFFGGRQLAGMGMMAAGQMGSNLYQQNLAEPEDKPMPGRDLAAKLGFSAMTTGGLASMFYKPVQGGIGAKVKGQGFMGAMVMAALAAQMVGAIRQGFTEYSKRNNERNQLETRLDDIRKLQQTTQNTASQLDKTLRSLQTGRSDVDFQSASNLRDTIMAVVPGAVTATDDPLSDLKLLDRPLTEMQTELRAIRATIEATRVLDELRNADLRAMVEEDAKLQQELQTGNRDVVEQMKLVARREEIRATITPKLMGGLEAAALQAGVGRVGLNTAIPDGVVSGVAEAQGTSAEVVMQRLLPKFLKGSSRQELQIDDLLQGRTAMQIRNEGFVQYEEGGPIQNIATGEVVASTVDAIADFRDQMIATNGILLDLSKSFDGVARLRPEMMTELIHDVILSSRDLLERNNRQLSASAFRMDRMSRPGVSFGPDRLDALRDQAATLRNIRENGSQGIEAPTIGSGANDFNIAVRTLTGMFGGEAARRDGISLGGITNDLGTMAMLEPRFAEIAARNIQAFIDTRGVETSEPSEDGTPSASAVEFVRQIVGLERFGRFKDRAQSLDTMSGDELAQAERQIMDEALAGFNKQIGQLPEQFSDAIRTMLAQSSDFSRRSIDELSGQYRRLTSTSDISMEEFLGRDDIRPIVDEMQQQAADIGQRLNQFDTTLRSARDAGASTRVISDLEMTLRDLSTTFNELDAIAGTNVGSLERLQSAIDKSVEREARFASQIERLTVRSTAGEFAGLSGANLLRDSDSRIVDLLKEIADNTTGMTSEQVAEAISGLESGLVAVRSQAAADAERRAAIRGGLEASVRSSSALSRIGLQAEPQPFIEMALAEIRELTERASQASTDPAATAAITKALSPLSPLVSQLLAAQSGQSEVNRLLAPVGEQALVDRIEAAINAGASTEEILSDPLVKYAVQQSSLAQQKLGELTSQQLQESLLGVNESMDSTLKQIQKDLAKVLGPDVAARVVTPTGFRTGTADSKAPDVSRGRINKDGVAATLHKGEIVLNRKESDQYEKMMGSLGRNSFASGTGGGIVDPREQFWYHGSGADFDKFDMSFMGKGEGNQAFGWGMYFAERQRLASDYRNRYSPPAQLMLKGSPLPVGRDRPGEFDSYYASRLERILRHPDPSDRAYEYRDLVETVSDHVLHHRGRGNTVGLERLEQVEDIVKRHSIDDFSHERPGFTYKTRLKPSLDEYMLFDRPMSGQSPLVSDAIDSFGIKRSLEQFTLQKDSQSGFADHYHTWSVLSEIDRKRGLSRYSFGRSAFSATLRKRKGGPQWVVDTRDPRFLFDNAKLVTYADSLEEAENLIQKAVSAKNTSISAEDAYLAVGSQLTGREARFASVGMPAIGDREASLALLERGVRGIRFLDGRSRSAGEGTYNHVMFDANDIEIVDRFDHNEQSRWPRSSQSTRSISPTPSRLSPDGTAIMRGDGLSATFLKNLQLEQLRDSTEIAAIRGVPTTKRIGDLVPELLFTPQMQQFLGEAGVQPAFGNPSAGSYGIAYPAGENSHLKFTAFEREAQNALKLMQVDHPHVVGVQGIAKFGEFEDRFTRSDKPVYGILMESLDRSNVINNYGVAEIGVSDHQTAWMAHHPDDLSTQVTTDEFRPTLARQLKQRHRDKWDLFNRRRMLVAGPHQSPHFGEERQAAALSLELTAARNRVYNDLGINVDDVHSGNFGWKRSGDLAFFDTDSWRIPDHGNTGSIPDLGGIRRSQSYRGGDQAITAYHGTASPDEFAQLRPLSHVGSLSAAKYVAAAGLDGPNARLGVPRVMAGDLELGSVIDFVDSKRAHSPHVLAEDLHTQGLLSYVEQRYVSSRGNQAEQHHALTTILKKRGIDTLRYTNLNEDIGSLSYVVTDPDQFTIRDVEHLPRPRSSQSTRSISHNPSRLSPDGTAIMRGDGLSATFLRNLQLEQVRDSSQRAPAIGSPAERLAYFVPDLLFTPQMQQFLGEAGVQPAFGGPSAGSYGIAYPAGENSHLKFSASENEAQNALKLMQVDHPNVVGVQGVAQFGRFNDGNRGNNQPLYGILMESLDRRGIDNSSTARRGITDHDQVWRRHQSEGHIATDKIRHFFADRLKHVHRRGWERFNQANDPNWSFEPVRPQWGEARRASELGREATIARNRVRKDLGVDLVDVHSGNIGRKNGNFAFMDFDMWRWLDGSQDTGSVPDLGGVGPRISQSTRGTNLFGMRSQPQTANFNEANLIERRLSAGVAGFREATFTDSLGKYGFEPLQEAVSPKDGSSNIEFRATRAGQHLYDMSMIDARSLMMDRMGFDKELANFMTGRVNLSMTDDQTQYFRHDLIDRLGFGDSGTQASMRDLEKSLTSQGEYRHLETKLNADGFVNFLTPDLRGRINVAQSVKGSRLRGLRNPLYQSTNLAGTTIHEISHLMGDIGATTELDRGILPKGNDQLRKSQSLVDQLNRSKLALISDPTDSAMRMALAETYAVQAGPSKIEMLKQGKAKAWLANSNLGPKFIDEVLARRLELTDRFPLSKKYQTFLQTQGRGAMDVIKRVEAGGAKAPEIVEMMNTNRAAQIEALRAMGYDPMDLSQASYEGVFGRSAFQARRERYRGQIQQGLDSMGAFASKRLGIKMGSGTGFDLSQRQPNPYAKAPWDFIGPMPQPETVRQPRTVSIDLTPRTAPPRTPRGKGLRPPGTSDLLDLNLGQPNVPQAPISEVATRTMRDLERLAMNQIPLRGDLDPLSTYGAQQVQPFHPLDPPAKRRRALGIDKDALRSPRDLPRRGPRHGPESILAIAARHTREMDHGTVMRPFLDTSRPVPPIPMNPFAEWPPRQSSSRPRNALDRPVIHPDWEPSGPRTSQSLRQSFWDPSDAHLASRPPEGLSYLDDLMLYRGTVPSEASSIATDSSSGPSMRSPTGTPKSIPSWSQRTANVLSYPAAAIASLGDNAIGRTLTSPGLWSMALIGSYFANDWLVDKGVDQDLIHNTQRIGGSIFSVLDSMYMMNTGKGVTGFNMLGGSVKATASVVSRVGDYFGSKAITNAGHALRSRAGGVTAANRWFGKGFLPIAAMDLLGSGFRAFGGERADTPANLLQLPMDMIYGGVTSAVGLGPSFMDRSDMAKQGQNLAAGMMQQATGDSALAYFMGREDTAPMAQIDMGRTGFMAQMEMLGLELTAPAMYAAGQTVPTLDIFAETLADYHRQDRQRSTSDTLNTPLLMMAGPQHPEVAKLLAQADVQRRETGPAPKSDRPGHGGFHMTMREQIEAYLKVIGRPGDDQGLLADMTRQRDEELKRYGEQGVTGGLEDGIAKLTERRHVLLKQRQRLDEMKQRSSVLGVGSTSFVAQADLFRELELKNPNEVHTLMKLGARESFMRLFPEMDASVDPADAAFSLSVFGTSARQSLDAWTDLATAMPAWSTPVDLMRVIAEGKNSPVSARGLDHASIMQDIMRRDRRVSQATGDLSLSDYQVPIASLMSNPDLIMDAVGRQGKTNADQDTLFNAMVGGQLPSELEAATVPMLAADRRNKFDQMVDDAASTVPRLNRQYAGVRDDWMQRLSGLNASNPRVGDSVSDYASKLEANTKNLREWLRPEIERADHFGSQVRTYASMMNEIQEGFYDEGVYGNPVWQSMLLRNPRVSREARARHNNGERLSASEIVGVNSLPDTSDLSGMLAEARRLLDNPTDFTAQLESANRLAGIANESSAAVRQRETSIELQRDADGNLKVPGTETSVTGWRQRVMATRVQNLNRRAAASRGRGMPVANRLRANLGTRRMDTDDAFWSYVGSASPGLSGSAREWSEINEKIGAIEGNIGDVGRTGASLLTGESGDQQMRLLELRARLAEIEANPSAVSQVPATSQLTPSMVAPLSIEPLATGTAWGSEVYRALDEMRQSAVGRKAAKEPVRRMTEDDIEAFNAFMVKTGGIPSFDTGSTAQANTRHVDSQGRLRADMYALMHKGEIVLNRDEAQALLEQKEAARLSGMNDYQRKEREQSRAFVRDGRSAHNPVTITTESTSARRPMGIEEARRRLAQGVSANTSHDAYQRPRGANPLLATPAAASNAAPATGGSDLMSEIALRLPPAPTQDTSTNTPVAASPSSFPVLGGDFFRKLELNNAEIDHFLQEQRARLNDSTGLDITEAAAAAARMESIRKQRSRLSGSEGMASLNSEDEKSRKRMEKHTKARRSRGQSPDIGLYSDRVVSLHQLRKHDEKLSEEQKIKDEVSEMMALRSQHLEHDARRRGKVKSDELQLDWTDPPETPWWFKPDKPNPYKSNRPDIKAYRREMEARDRLQWALANRDLGGYQQQILLDISAGHSAQDIISDLPLYVRRGARLNRTSFWGQPLDKPGSYASGTMAQAGTGGVDLKGKIKDRAALATLHQGEIVLSKTEADAYLAAISGMSEGRGIPSVRPVSDTFSDEARRSIESTPVIAGGHEASSSAATIDSMGQQIEGMRAAFDSFAADAKQFLENIASQESVEHVHSGQVELTADSTLTSLLQQVLDELRKQSGAPVVSTVAGSIIKGSDTF